MGGAIQVSMADVLAQHRRDTRPGTRCGMCVLLPQLSEADRTALQGALDDNDYAAAWIESALQDMGYEIKAWTIRNHRHGLCKRR